MNYSLKHAVLLMGTGFVLSSTAWACDLCAIHGAIERKGSEPGTLTLGIAEQFTSYGKIQEGGRYVDNSEHQRMRSSITQVYGTYDLSEDVALQLQLPFISRRFKRFEDGSREVGSEEGIGDISVLARYTPFRIQETDSVFTFQVFGGVKLPTGDSDQLKEEEHRHDDGDGEHHAEEGDVEHSEEVHDHGSKHGGVDHGAESIVRSAIHGHDLALGSGSVDFPVGFQIYAQKDRFFGRGNLQYMIRTEGDHQYEYADDLLWEVGPGYFLALEEHRSLAVALNLSGEYKRKDRVGGEREDDTGIRSVFIGPQLIASGERWSAELGCDIPLDINNTGYQAVADLRVRAAVTYTF